MIRKKILLATLIQSLTISLLTIKTNNTVRAYDEGAKQMEEKVEQQNKIQAKELFASGEEKAMAGFRSLRIDLYADALEDVEKGLRLDSRNAQMHYYAANLKAKLGDLDGMIESFDKTKEIVLENGDAELAKSIEDEKHLFIRDFAELQGF